MKTEELKQWFDFYKNCPRQLREASDFEWSVNVGCVKHGSTCDSSTYSSTRAKFVEKALISFVKDNKEDILELAAKMVEKELKKLQ